ncbi:MAG: hypothetical protein HKN45_05945 [Flavobacteriales bacterium]|nr:hypothetical protein [Flavobacteriales bacterium]
MKRNILILAAIFAVSIVSAQDLTSKKGEPMLPEGGEYALGADATPFLNYFGNFIGGNGLNAAPVFAPHPLASGGTGPLGFAIYGKKFIDAQNAYRATVRLGITSATTRTFVPDLDSGADPGDVVEDKATTSTTGVTIGLGKEMRRGNTRLQGVYGAAAQLSFASMNTSFEYGNDIEDMGSALIEMKTGSTFTFGVGVFGGVEYFFVPKMSIAGEYGWGLAFTSTGDGETTTEVDGGDDVVTQTGGSSTFILDTAALDSFNLRVMFHF